MNSSKIIDPMSHKNDTRFTTAGVTVSTYAQETDPDQGSHIYANLWE